MSEKLIVVLYIGVSGVELDEISDFVKKVTEKISPSFEGELITIPVQGYDTRIDCINPKYITDAELIRQHTDMMQKLQEELQFQAELLRNSRNE